MQYYCSVCNEPISQSVYRYSMDKFGKALCREHQKTVTTQALKLSKALNEKGVNHTLEYHDGFKHVDIAIEWAKLYLEIEGSQHLYTPKQMITDYKRDKYSLKDGFYTIRIPNTIIQKDVRSVAECVADLASLRHREISNNQKTPAPDDTSKAVAEPQVKKSRVKRKATLTFASVILILCISLVALSVTMSNQIDTLQTANNSLESQLSSLQYNLTDLQSQYDQLYSQYQQLQSDPSSQSSQITELENQITSLENQIATLQSQLNDANDIIGQLQGQTGILPTYMDLGYDGSYYLHLSLQNTGASPITQIFVTLNSVQIPMNFTYLDTIVDTNAPLPAYQTATGRENVSPPITGIGTYPLIIQAQATNGTVYNYQTTITAHI